MPQGTAPALKRSIGLVRATAMVVGTIVGASIFVQPSVITGEMRSVGGVVLAWTLAGVLTLAGALICAELASAYPRSGGVYVFLREAYSPALGFLWGWAMFWSMHSGIIAAIAMVFARFVAYLAPLGGGGGAGSDVGIRAVAITAVFALSAVNYYGVALGSGLQAALTIGKVLAIVAIIVVGFWLGAGLPADAVLGRGGGTVMSALVACSAFGALAGIVLTGPRVYFSMARDGLLFRWVGAIHPRFGTPHRAIVLQAVWSAVLVATGTYRALFTRVVFTEWIFFAVMAIGLVLLRSRPGYTPAYRARGFPAAPLVFAGAAAVVAVSQIVAHPRDSAMGLLLVLAGLPVYVLWAVLTSSESEAGRSSTSTTTS